MASAVKPTVSEAEIFARLWDNKESVLPLPLARHILKLKFGATDQVRMHDLAEKNREQGLTASEQDEIDAYIRVGDLLAILQSRARRRLKKERDRHHG